MENGPIYGVELIDSLPLGGGQMRQAMPSREDLERVSEINQRTVAGFEVLLGHWHRLESHARELEAIVRRSIWHGESCLVPMFVATCPECGGQLLIRTQQWETETGKPSVVEYECLRDEGLEPTKAEPHLYHQSDWQPVMDTVEKWFEVQRD